MADNDLSRDDRPLPPSARRLQKAREDGRVPRSRELGHLAMMGAALAALVLLGPTLGASARELMARGLQIPRTLAMDNGRITERLSSLGTDGISALLPMVGLMAVVAIVAAMIPGGPVLTAKPLMPDFSRLHPLNGLGRLLSRDSLVDTLKIGALALILGTVGFFAVSGQVERLAGMASMSLDAALTHAFEAIREAVTLVLGVLFLAALIDVPWQWFKHHDGLRMTHREARDEAKEAEGNPLIKGKIRSRQREIAKARMLSAVPSADVIITNPTHYAVAVRYDEFNMGAPRVVAKGADHLAARIRAIAQESGVPMFEAPPLARALYANVEVDREIPVALYNAVAQVLAYVYQLRHFVPGKHRAPQMPEGFEIPPGMDPEERAT